VIVMRGMIRNIAVMGCLALPLGLLGAGTEWSTQKELKVAARIKKEVAKDEALQPSSRDIDVTIRNGVVTLKGMVRSETESQEILGKAESEVIQKTPPALINSAIFRFDNQLEVAPQ
jgi:osmotically-inducible protein OsmY